MPDRPDPAEALDRITADALALHRALLTNATDHAHELAARITDAQVLADTCLRLFLDLTPHTPRTTSADLLLLDRVAHIAKAAQDAGAELTAALARAVENQHRRADATSKPVVLIGPSPQQFIESATDLLDRIPALYHAIHRDRLVPPNPPTHLPH
ncbi:hypothetical protein [Streptomyces sp. NEAU-S7GS2]|uniref:hypothetical protein n=1 Tax=Streptomyces sp. NEAU-S7GS2 TaxID=2202000 RepID=UPI001EF45364|nr:hypothetical protein [Streptomyces sp. NEAU-S7GS2]